MVEQSFDVFLAHSSQDKPLIRQLYRKLKDRGIKPWLDEEEIAPGTSFQDEIQQAIARIKTAAICIGQGGLGKWEALELKAFISQCVERGIPVIPVLLPEVAEIPENLLFLKEFNAVAFKGEIEDEQALDYLGWGITKQKTQAKPISDQKNLIVAPTPSVVALSIDDDLSSEALGVTYYARLRDFLKSKRWKTADQETGNCMCEVMERQTEGWLRIEDIENFPHQDLHTIDQLWVKYSNGHFGFSVQKKIWQACGSPAKYDKDWEKFGEAVGWKDPKGRFGLLSWYSYENLTFALKAPTGHLPILGTAFKNDYDPGIIYELTDFAKSIMKYMPIFNVVDKASQKISQRMIQKRGDAVRYISLHHLLSRSDL